MRIFDALMPSCRNSAAIDCEGATNRSTSSKTVFAAASRASRSCFVIGRRRAARTNRPASPGNRRDIAAASRGGGQPAKRDLLIKRRVVEAAHAPPGVDDVTHILLGPMDPLTA